MAVKILPPVDALAEFINQLKTRHIRLVKLTDYGDVEPIKRGSGFVLQPMVRVVATALDVDAREIVSWAVEGEARRMVTATAGAGRGADPERVIEKRRARDVLRQLGYEVDEGEWDVNAAEQVIAVLAEATRSQAKVRKPA